MAVIMRATTGIPRPITPGPRALPSRKEITNWPSARLVELAEIRAAAAERLFLAKALPRRGTPADAPRRAYRLRQHPDRFADPERKAWAKQILTEAEEVFRQILDHGGGHGGP